jgi:hypothetical protein
MNVTISVIKPSSIRRTSSASAPSGIAGPARVSCDRRLQVGVGHNAVEATKSFGAESVLALTRQIELALFSGIGSP